MHLPHFLLPLACAVIAGGVVFVYGKQGSWVVASVLTYLAALSTMELAVKCVFQTAFRFPQLLTAMHAAVSALLCLPVLLHRSMKEGQEIDLPTAREFFLFISPIGLASAASIFTNNEALRLCTVSIVVIVASTGCICTMGVVRLLGMPVDPLLLFPATIVVVGGSGGESPVAGRLRIWEARLSLSLLAVDRAPEAGPKSGARAAPGFAPESGPRSVCSGVCVCVLQACVRACVRAWMQGSTSACGAEVCEIVEVSSVPGRFRENRRWRRCSSTSEP